MSVRECWRLDEFFLQVLREYVTNYDDLDDQGPSMGSFIAFQLMVVSQAAPMKGKKMPSLAICVAFLRIFLAAKQSYLCYFTPKSSMPCSKNIARASAQSSRSQRALIYFYFFFFFSADNRERERRSELLAGPDLAPLSPRPTR